MSTPTADAVAQRRARVAELNRDGVSIRETAATLGISKDTVYRDRLVNAATPTATERALHRDKADQAAAALQELRAAVTATTAARPAYQLLVDDETAACWIAQLREDTATLTALVESFRDAYSHLTDATATPDRDTATPTRQDDDMEDLPQFLHDRLDEDEQAARSHRQFSPDWYYDDSAGEIRDFVNRGTVAFVPSELDAAHIVRHDPARTLAEIDAKRQALGHYQRIRQHLAKSDGGDDYVFADGAVHRQLQYMALPYAAHPDYREEWRPTPDQRV